MHELIEKYLAHWEMPSNELCLEIFHNDFYHRGCSKNASGKSWQYERSSDAKDLRVLHKVAAGNEGFIILENTDEITSIYYRYAIYLKAKDGKVIEEVLTKERIEKW